MLKRRDLFALAVLCVPAIASPALGLNLTQFDHFTPLPASAGPIPVGSAGEAKPLTLSSDRFVQRSIVSRNEQLAQGQPNTGNFDMLTLNENGPQAGRFLFSVYETGQSGIQRTDLQTGVTQTIFMSPGVAPSPAAHVAFDAAYWTPWGTFITAEENWSGTGTGSDGIPDNTQNPYGRLFELTTPLADPAVAQGNTLHRNVIPRTSHEGIQFDSAGNMYFIDELNGGNIYKYTSQTPGAPTFFDAGQTSVLRVGDGLGANAANAQGAFTWIPFTDTTGAGLAGAVIITDPNGITSVDARATANLAAFKGTDYQRPEDAQIKILANGDEVLYFATTTTDDVWQMNLDTGLINRFISQGTIDAATGLAVGSAFNNPDNLALDADGNLYIIEDSAGGSENDVWFVFDTNHDGIAESIGRWATNGVVGSELTGLYFSPFDPNVAFINVQHPSSQNDRTIMITTIPEPATASLGAIVAGLLAVRRRRRA